MFTKTFLTAGLAALVAPAFCMEWTADFEAAKAKAKAENKALLVDFTGSDWCTFCIKLRKDVLDKPEFDAYAKDKFVPVEIDLPRDLKKISQEQMQKNVKLSQAYNVQGFPTILVMNPAGEVTGGFSGYAPMETVTKTLDTGLANIKALEDARKIGSAEERLAALKKIHDSLGRGAVNAADALRDEMIKNDPEDKSGLRHKRDVANQLRELDQKLENGGKPLSPQAVLEVVKEMESRVFPENKLDLIFTKMSAMTVLATTKEDVQNIKDTVLRELDSIQSNEVEELKKQVEKRFADPEVVLKKAAELRAILDKAQKQEEKPAAPAEPALPSK